MNSLLGFVLFSFLFSCNSLNTNEMENIVVKIDNTLSPIPGINHTDMYYPLIHNKRVGLVVNQTSTFVNGTHLADSLIQSGIDIVRIFAPEHGFRGDASAGETIVDGVDSKTGKKIVSLYGKNKKPSVEDLAGIDVLVFDIQDVGVRFYTYISTLEYVMEAAAENNIDMIILDRPNPNGNFIDGPILETPYKSFVGMQHIPLVYAMTIGEYGQMLKGEKLINQSEALKLKVIACTHYDRDVMFELPIAPSPNLPDILSILLYPSLGFFEGTDFSEGRGTAFPFKVYGHPQYQNKTFSFKPVELPHAKNPKWANSTCYGFNLGDLNPKEVFDNNHLDLSYLYDAYQKTGSVETFFKFPDFFDKLAGTNQIRTSFLDHKSIDKIKKEWTNDIDIFKGIRTKYLIYPESKRLQE